jgi:carbonic anhydrase/acetyltransferase-like protein (isoleucine patch superfamily)
MILHCGNIGKWVTSRIESHIKDKTKPATAVLVTGLVSDMTRSKADLLVENALLRQQLIVLKR